MQPKHLDPDTLDIEELKQRFLVVQAVEAARTVEDHVITDMREADVGSILGFGFAPFTGGTLSYIDFMGTKKFVDLCHKLEAKYGSRFTPPKLLEEMAAKGETFYGRFPPKKHAKRYRSRRRNGRGRHRAAFAAPRLVGRAGRPQAAGSRDQLRQCRLHPERSRSALSDAARSYDAGGDRDGTHQRCPLQRRIAAAAYRSLAAVLVAFLARTAPAHFTVLRTDHRTGDEASMAC